MLTALMVPCVVLIAWLVLRALGRARVAKIAAGLGLECGQDGIFRGYVGTTHVAFDVRRDGLAAYTWLSVSGGLPTALIIRGPADDVHVVGDAQVIAALFDDDLRAVVSDAVKAGWSFETGTWLWHQPRRVPDLAALVMSGVALADRLRTAYAALPDEATAAARADAEAEERIFAALQQGDDDDPSIRDATDVEVDDEDRAILANLPLTLEWYALEARKVTGQPELRAESLRLLVKAVHTHVASIEALARGHLAAVLDRLIEERNLPSEVALVTIDVLTRIDHVRREEALLALLTREGDVRLAAIGALGAVGSVAAVPVLLALRDVEVLAARHAIDRIRARAAVTDGGLAIVEPAGGLAVVDEPTDR